MKTVDVNNECTVGGANFTNKRQCVEIQIAPFWVNITKRTEGKRNNQRKHQTHDFPTEIAIL